MEIILKPIITEKATNDSELRNRYTFVVSRFVNKIQIKKAIQEKYSVTVEKVRTQIYGPERSTKYTKKGICLLYTSPSPRDRSLSRMPSSA